MLRYRRAGQQHGRLHIVPLRGPVRLWPCLPHVLKGDITKTPAAFSQSLPFSAQLRAALKTFLASNL